MKLSEEEKKARKRAYNKRYDQRPEVRARNNASHKKSYQRPEVNARKKAYQKKYRQSPKVKAKRKALYKRYYQIPEVNARIRARATLASKKRYQKIRDEIFTLLGRKCVRCGFSDLRALQFDHKNGGGSKDRSSMSLIIRHKNILKNLSKFQTLCANCNWIKRYKNNEVRKENIKEEISMVVTQVDNKSTEPKPHTSEPAYPSTFRKIDKEKVRSEVVKIIRKNKKLEEAIANLNDKEEISAVVTQVKDKPAEITYFTVDGTTVPDNQVTKSGTRFFRTIN